MPSSNLANLYSAALQGISQHTGSGSRSSQEARPGRSEAAPVRKIQPLSPCVDSVCICLTKELVKAISFGFFFFFFSFGLF